jgi:hypothetical protein
MAQEEPINLDTFVNDDDNLTKEKKEDLFEARLIDLKINEWDKAYMSLYNRPDYDIELEKNGNFTSYEVKTQGIYAEDRNGEIHAYAEIGEFGKQKPIDNEDFYHWVKTGLFASNADKYIYFKKISNESENYNVYEIDKKELLDDINYYFFYELFFTVKDYKNNGFVFKVNMNGIGKKYLDLSKKDINRDISKNKKNSKDFRRIPSKNGKILGIAITYENYGERINYNIVLDLSRYNIKYNDVNINQNNIMTYFDGIYLDKKNDNILIDTLKEKNDYTTHLKWKYDLIFDKSVNNKYPNLELNKILRINYPKFIRYFLQDKIEEKSLGIEKIGVGKYVSPSNSDSSSSSEGEENSLKVYNRLKRNINKKYKIKKEKYL